MALLRLFTMKNSLRFLILLLPFALGGCVIPFPFRTPKTSAVSGRVVDSMTLHPLSKANVRFLRDDKGTPFDTQTALTDVNGYFRLKKTYNYHAGGVVLGHAGGILWPPGENSNDIQIEHVGYVTRSIWVADDKDLGDVPLRPKARP
jgi:hypothetical protein